MKQFRRALLLLLIVALLMLTLTSCKEKYKLRKSTDKESATVMTLGEDVVPFEVLYAFFRNQCDALGAKADYFTGPEGAARYESVMLSARREVANIYAMFAACRAAGIDPYGEEVEAAILEYLKLSVEGGYVGDYYVQGFGKYDDYLAYVRTNFHMTDSVNRLIIRYGICEDLLIDYYKTNFPHTDADVAGFFASDECVYIIWACRAPDALGLDEAGNYELIVKARNALIAGDHRKAIQNSTSSTTDFYMGRYTKDAAYYEELIRVTYALAENETSEILDLGSEGYAVVKRLPKQEAHLTERFEDIRDLYLCDALYKNVEDRAAALLTAAAYDANYFGLTSADFFAQ